MPLGGPDYEPLVMPSYESESCQVKPQATEAWRVLGISSVDSHCASSKDGHKWVLNISPYKVTQCTEVNLFSAGSCNSVDQSYYRFLKPFWNKSLKAWGLFWFVFNSELGTTVWHHKCLKLLTRGLFLMKEILLGYSIFLRFFFFFFFFFKAEFNI